MEYTSPDKDFAKACKEIGCEQITSAAYCHWENGVAERVILKMMRHAFCILAQRDLPAQFWLMALKHVYMVLACCPHAHFNDKDTPFRRWYDKTPNLKLLRGFGADVRVHVPKDHPDFKKYTNPRAFMGIYIGYKLSSSAHKVWRPAHDGVKGEVVYPGDRLCKFFESFDDHNFLRPTSNADFIKYAGIEDTGKSNEEKPIGDGIRICKWFGSELCFGTVTESGEKGDFAFDVNYDDGDYENMDKAELDDCLKLYEKNKGNPSSQQKSIFELMPKNVIIEEVHDHKIEVDAFNSALAG